MKPVFIDREKLMDFDIFGTTSFGFLGGLIRFVTWGIPGLGNMKDASHTGFIVKYNGVWCACQMMGTQEVLRYVSGVLKKVIEPDEWAILPHEQQTTYKPVMLKNGLQMDPLSMYENDIFKPHFVFVGRHPDMTNEKRKKAMEYIQQKLDNGIPYDIEELVGFPFGKDKNKVADICSRLVYKVLDFLGFAQPAPWRDKVAPADYQKWYVLKLIDWKLSI